MKRKGSEGNRMRKGGQKKRRSKIRVHPQEGNLASCVGGYPEGEAERRGSGPLREKKVGRKQERRKRGFHSGEERRRSD